MSTESERDVAPPPWVRSALMRFGLLLLVLGCCVGCDQATKAAARAASGACPSASVELLSGSVVLRYVENRGGFMSFGSGLSEQARFAVFRVAIPLLTLLGIGLVATQYRLVWRQWIGLALLLGGGASNVVDRLLNDGAVVDFVSIGFGSLRTGIFNLADVVIVVGALLTAFATTEDAASETVASEHAG